MIIEFKRVTIADRELILSHTLSSPYMSCDYSFANLYCWGAYYNTHIAFHKGMMLVKFQSKEGGRPACLMPVGNGNLQEVLTDLSKDFKEEGYTLTLLAVPPEGVERLRQSMCENIHVLSNANYIDYIYLREKLVTLSGKKLQSKRNHINRFISTYPDYTYEEISDANAAECIELEEKWFVASEQTDDIKAERNMVTQAIREREAIGLIGGCIRVDGKVIAFSMGMPINHSTFGVHIEKADVAYDGAFTMINKEFASRIPGQYTYINREEDLGIEGLRQAKLSYRPEILLEKHTVLMRCE